MSIPQPFSPVPRSPRHDGWSPDKQRDFIAALEECGIVRMAAQKVGMGHASAYRLRQAKGAEDFARAWDEALSIGVSHLQDIAMERAIHGTPIVHFYKGEARGESRFYDNRLLMFMLQHNNSRRYSRFSAEYDRVEDAERVRHEDEERRLKTIEKAEEMMESIMGLLDFRREELAALKVKLEETEPKDSPEAEALSEEIKDLDDRIDKIDAKYDDLQNMVENLRRVDTLRADEARITAMERSGQWSMGIINRNRKHLRWQKEALGV